METFEKETLELTAERAVELAIKFEDEVVRLLRSGAVRRVT